MNMAYRDESVLLSPLPLQLLYQLFRRYFILLTVFIGLGGFYLSETYSLSEEKNMLLKRCDELEKRIVLLKEEKREYEEQLASASDLQWQELMLIRQLGVVPKGWKKVIINR